MMMAGQRFFLRALLEGPLSKKVEKVIIPNPKDLTDENFTLASGADLDQRRLEKFKKTADENRNRDEKEKFDALKPGTISAGKLFDQKTNNPIDELDQNISIKKKNLPKVSQDVIGVTNDYINYSSKRVVERVKK